MIKTVLLMLMILVGYALYTPNSVQATDCSQAQSRASCSTLRDARIMRRASCSTLRSARIMRREARIMRREARLVTRLVTRLAVRPLVRIQMVEPCCN